MKKRWFVAGAVLALVIVWLVKSWPEAGDIYAMKIHQREMKNLESEVVQIDLAGHYFNVPMRYMYGEAREKYRRWPTAKKERTKVDYFNLSMLLPDLRPYYPEDDVRWNAQGHGDRVEIMVTKFRGLPENWNRGNEINIALIERFMSEGRFYKQLESKYGLARYTDAQKQPYDNGDTYFAHDRDTRLECDSENPPTIDWKGPYFPSCKVTSNFRPLLVLEYRYSLEYVSHWRDIDDGLKTLLERFARVAESEQQSEQPNRPASAILDSSDIV